MKKEDMGVVIEGCGMVDGVAGLVTKMHAFILQARLL